jgi:hypothetical protein
VHLGQLLVHLGIIDDQQLAAALQQQVVYGGRLGTNLIELGYASQDEVARGLAKLHGVPGAMARHLARHDPAPLSLISPELAAHHVAFPVAYAMAGGKRLVMCMRDPNNQTALAQITAAAGMPVVASVAPEIAVYYWLERCYRIRRPQRFAHSLPGHTTPLPRSISETHEAVQPPDDHSIDVDIDIDVDPDADLHESTAEMPAALQLVELDDVGVERDHSQYGIDAKEHVSLERMASGDTGKAPKLAPADLVEDRAESIAAAATGIAQAAMDTLPATPPTPPALAPGPKMTAEEATERITASTEREPITDAIIAYMRGAFGAGLIVLARDGLALGHKGFGGNFDEDTVESILVPLNLPSMFQAAHDARKMFRGAPPADGEAVHNRFFKLFRLSDAPREVVVLPVVIRDRVVCMFYAHGKDGGPIQDKAVARLTGLGFSTAEAFTSLIRNAKSK